VKVAPLLSPEVLPVPADPAQLQQVLLNLVLNAKAAMPDGGELRLSTRRLGEQGGVEVVVEDTGVGMDDATRERLFQPFFSTRAGGTGLGLAIVKQILDEHRGSIRVESQPGKGSRFTVTLPG
jgi:two-component system NtrC family sensor kinase